MDHRGVLEMDTFDPAQHDGFSRLLRQLVHGFGNGLGTVGQVRDPVAHVGDSRGGAVFARGRIAVQVTLRHERLEQHRHAGLRGVEALHQIGYTQGPAFALECFEHVKHTCS